MKGTFIKKLLIISLILVINVLVFAGGVQEGYINYDFIEYSNINNFKNYYNDGFIIYEKLIPNKMYVVDKNKNIIQGYENDRLTFTFTYDETGWLKNTEYYPYEYYPYHYWYNTIKIVEEDIDSIIIYSSQHHASELTPTLYIICKNSIDDLKELNQKSEIKELQWRWASIEIYVYENNLPVALYSKKTSAPEPVITERFFYDGKQRHIEDFENIGSRDLMYRIYDTDITNPVQYITAFSKETTNPNNYLYREVLFDEMRQIISYKLVGEEKSIEYFHKYTENMQMDVFDSEGTLIYSKKYGISDLEQLVSE
jgi:hypothetical protein